MGDRLVPDDGEAADDATLGEEAGSFSPESAEIPPPAMIECWRCGQTVPADAAKCPVCKATDLASRAAQASADATWSSILTAPTSYVPRRRRVEASLRSPILRILKYFLLLLLCSIIQSAVLNGMLDDQWNEARIAEIQRNLITTFEVVMSVLVVLACLRLPRPAPLPERTPARRAVGILSAVPLLGGALLVNLAYQHLLRKHLDAPDWMLDDTLFHGASLTWLTIAICLQPAVIEELFFRYLTLGHLRAEMSDHAAVWVSSLMFGLAHLGQPLGIPVLVVIGMALGYARLWSGSLFLPMLMHAAHNAVIVLLEVQR